MKSTCGLCDKKTKIGRNRSHAQNRTRRTFKANIQRVTMNFDNDKIKGDFCTKCIKRLKKELGQQKAALA